MLILCMCVCVGNHASAWLSASLWFSPATPDPATVHPAPTGAKPVRRRPAAHHPSCVPASCSYCQPRGDCVTLRTFYLFLSFPFLNLLFIFLCLGFQPSQLEMKGFQFPDKASHSPGIPGGSYRCVSTAQVRLLVFYFIIFEA